MYRFAYGVALLLVILNAPASGNELTLKYGSRSVDLAPYYSGFPYYIRAFSLQRKKLYYSKTESSGGAFLYAQPWNPDSTIAIKPDDAIAVTNTNLEKINFWGREYNKLLDGLVVVADEDKSENTNLWLFSEHEPEPVKLTQADYIYSFAQSDDERRIAYIARYGMSDHSEGCLEVLNLEEGGQAEIKKLFCDADNRIPAKLNSWADIRFDKQSVVLTAFADGDRNKSELYRYNLEDNSVSRLIDSHGSSWVSVISDWHDENQFLFIRDQDLLLYDLTSGSEKHLRQFKNSINNYGTLAIGGAQYIFIITRDIVRSKFELFRLEDGNLRQTAEFDSQMRLSVMDKAGDRLLLFKQSADTMLDYERVQLDKTGGIARKELVTGLKDLNNQLANCRVTRVSFDYSDESGNTPVTRSVDAYLYEPRDPIAAEDQLFIVKAFYGGKNRFTRGFHALCKVGVSILSPVVRGDGRFGASFEQSNDRENADAPIHDVMASARFLQARYNITDSRRIGTWGYSHGGWAATRSVSFPHPSAFEFGFAIAGAGYFDFIQIADEAPEGQTNIRGWIDKEFGDMKSQRQHLAAISPSQHIGLFKAQVFLFHGRNDERITVQHSISFAEKLRNANVPHELKIIDNQGHSISGASNWHDIYGAMFKFLEDVNRNIKSPPR